VGSPGRRYGRILLDAKSIHAAKQPALGNAGKLAGIPETAERFERLRRQIAQPSLAID